jgi:hypothetical protein
MKRSFVIFVLCFAALTQFNCSSNGKKSGAAPPDAAPATPITAANLIEHYLNEGPSGAGKYKGQRLAVTGVVERKGKDYLDRPYVELKHPTNRYMQVHCAYNEEQADAMAGVQIGQEVTIAGVCDGRLSTWVVLKDSVLQ